jgi:hypothetical protein
MRVQAAVIQDAPIAFDREKTMDKLERLIAEAAAGEAQLAVFPEAFVRGYPRGIDFGTWVGIVRRRVAISSGGTSMARSKCPDPTSTGSQAPGASMASRLDPPRVRGSAGREPSMST